MGARSRYSEYYCQIRVYFKTREEGIAELARLRVFLHRRTQKGFEDVNYILCMIAANEQRLTDVGYDGPKNEGNYKTYKGKDDAIVGYVIRCFVWGVKACSLSDDIGKNISKHWGRRCFMRYKAVDGGATISRLVSRAIRCHKYPGYVEYEKGDR